MSRTSPLTADAPRLARELALRLQAVNAAYAAMPFEEVVEAGELILLGIIRNARGCETSTLDNHLGRVGALRAEQAVAEPDVSFAFGELRACLASAVAALTPAEAEREPDLATLVEVAAEAERKLVELLRVPR